MYILSQHSSRTVVAAASTRLGRVIAGLEAKIASLSRSRRRAPGRWHTLRAITRQSGKPRRKTVERTPCLDAKFYQGAIRRLPHVSSARCYAIRGADRIYLTRRLPAYNRISAPDDFSPSDRTYSEKKRGIEHYLNNRDVVFMS